MAREQGHSWEVRFSGWKNGKPHLKTLTFDGAKYPTEADVPEVRMDRPGKKMADFEVFAAQAQGNTNPRCGL